MRTWITGAVVAAGLAGLGSAAQADVVLLRSTRKIENCWVLEQNQERVVVAIIRKGTAGTMTFRSIDVEQIITEDGPSFAVALEAAREQQAREEAERRAREEAARLAEQARLAREATPAGTPAAAADGAPAEAAAEAAADEETKLELIVVEPTPEQEKEIDKWVQQLGNSRANGAGFRRQAAMNGLAAIGPAAIGKITEAVGDATNPYRRKGAAQTLGKLAGADARLGLYYEAIPVLIERLSDDWAWARYDANQALEAILGTSFGTVDTQAKAASANEKKLQTEWSDLWEKKKAEPVPGGKAKKKTE